MLLEVYIVGYIKTLVCSDFRGHGQWAWSMGVVRTASRMSRKGIISHKGEKSEYCSSDEDFRNQNNCYLSEISKNGSSSLG